MPGQTMLRRWLAILLLALATPAFADSWALPGPESYASPDGQTRLRIIPRDLSSQLAYFDDKLRGKEPAGQQPGSRDTKARAILERRGPGGTWQIVWDRPLLNDVAPVHALVANGGRYVVTLDNWHGTGVGPRVIVIYGAAGRPIRAMPLQALLPQAYIDALPHSVSSIQWRGDPRLSADGQALILPVIVPDDSEEASRDPAFTDRRIRLADGAVIADTSLHWARLMMDAQRVLVARKAADQARLAFFTAPLRGPVPPTQSGWHQYLDEAFNRLDRGVVFDESLDGAYSITKVLRDPLDPDYAVSEGWLRDALLEPRDPDEVVAIATLSSPEHLLITLENILRHAPKNGMRGTRTYIALPPAYHARARAIFAPTGTRLICLDPAVPIPQRPERITALKRYFGS